MGKTIPIAEQFLANLLVMFDLNEMAIFVRVVETGSFIGAARLLGIPKTTVSRKVAQLEANLKARLLHRTTRKLNLTEVGELYFERCRCILQDIEEANLAVTAMQSTPYGTLRITATEGFGNAFLNDWLIEFLQQYEHINVEVLFSNSYVDLIAKGIDVGFRLGTPEDSSLVTRKLGTIADWLCASPQYIEARGEPRNPRDLSQHSCIVIGSLLELSQWQLGDGETDVAITVTGRVKVNSVRLAHRAALEGFGIARLPANVALGGIQTGQLVRVLQQWTPATRDVWVIYPSDRYLSPKVCSLLNFVTAKVTPQPPWNV